MGRKLLALGFRLLFGVTASHGFAVSAAADPARIADREDLVRESQRLAEEGNLPALYRLVLPFAEGGDPEAQFSLGVVLSAAQGADILPVSTRQRQALSLDWLRKAAANGHVRAISYLADIYRSGWLDEPRDLRKSACYETAEKRPENAEACLD